MTDDDNLMERRNVYKVEIVQTYSSRFTNTIVTKITKYASEAQGYLTDSFKGAVADSNGEVMTIAYGNNVVPFMMSQNSRKEHHRHHNHRISLLGFRNRLAVFILAFSLVLAVACSYLRRTYLASLHQQAEESTLESALTEKVALRIIKTDETPNS